MLCHHGVGRSLRRLAGFVHRAADRRLEYQARIVAGDDLGGEIDWASATGSDEEQCLSLADEPLGRARQRYRDWIRIRPSYTTIGATTLDGDEQGAAIVAGQVAIAWVLPVDVSSGEVRKASRRYLNEGLGRRR